MKQITAVEWFEQKLDDLDIEIPFGIFEQAKEMEKRQKIEFGKQIADHWGMVTIPIENVEKYYNETYKND